MPKRVLIIVTLVAIVAAAAPDADGGIRFGYSSGNWRIGSVFGGYGTPYYSYYSGSPYTYGYYPTTSYYAAPIYISVPTRLRNLPYIPPGTIYTVDTSARYGYYRYPYRHYPYYRRYAYPGYGFAAAYLATAPTVRRRVVTTTPSSSATSPAAPVVHNKVNIVVNVTTAGRTETRVTVQDNSWKRDLWRVPASGSTATTTTTTTDTSAPVPRTRTATAVPAPGDTEEAYLATLVRGDDGQRRKAAKELRRFNNAKVVAALVGALGKDGDDDVREEVARSLGAMLARKAHDALWKAAREDADRNVRDAARESALKVEAYYDIKSAK
jgi:HEAT repeats